MISDDAGRVCLRGAIIGAAGLLVSDSLARNGGWHWGHVYDGSIPRSGAIREADWRVSQALDGDPATWNNTVAKSQEEVVAKLRAVALGG